MNDESTMSDWWTFLKLWARSPIKMGAMQPSTKVFARCVARHLNHQAADPVLELGGGTGAVTEALLEFGVKPEKLYVVEKVPELCAVLRRRFPKVTVLEGSAVDLKRMLAEHGVTRISGVASTLPLLWFSDEEQRQIATDAFALMGEDAIMTQMTNQFRSPLKLEGLPLTGKVVDFVWRNWLPSWVWAYRRAGAATTSRAA